MANQTHSEEIPLQTGEPRSSIGETGWHTGSCRLMQGGSYDCACYAPLATPPLYSG
jgi:hypothetical protein